MRINEYQRQSQTTARFSEDTREALANVIIGICGETGELTNLFKKLIFGQYCATKTADWDKKARAEIGDVLWYLAALCERMGWSLEEIAAENLAKLAERYK